MILHWVITALGHIRDLLTVHVENFGSTGLYALVLFIFYKSKPG